MSKPTTEAAAILNSYPDPYLAAIQNPERADWGIETIRDVCHKLGDPHLAYPTIHIAGTKGKGSTSAMIAQCLMESGLRVGLYTSPSLVEWRERIQVNRELITVEKLTDLINEIQFVASPTSGITAFEIATALAFWHFAREGVEAAVIEVGLGGRLDATNIVEPQLSVMTNISLDHTQILGDTIQEIAADKSMIIKTGKPAVSAPQIPAVEEIIRARAAETGSQITVVGKEFQYETLQANLDGVTIQAQGGTYQVGLAGLFQAENAATAVAALHVLQQTGLSVSDSGILKGLASVTWSARFEIVSRQPLTIVDGAHNSYSMERLAESLRALLPPDKTLTIVFGCMADKTLAGMLIPLIPLADEWILTQVQNPRAASPADLQAALLELNPSAQVAVSSDIVHAIHMIRHKAKDRTILITGSLAIAGNALSILRAI